MQFQCAPRLWEMERLRIVHQFSELMPLRFVHRGACENKVIGPSRARIAGFIHVKDVHLRLKGGGIKKAARYKVHYFKAVPLVTSRKCGSPSRHLLINPPVAFVKCD